MLEKRSQLAAKVEVTEGTAETLAAADAVSSGAIKFDPEIEVEDLNLVSSSLSPYPGIAGARQAKMSFECPLKGSGVAGTAPEIGELIRACGYVETVVASTSVTYTPTSSAIPSLTIAKYVDGKRYLMAGARGNFDIELKAGKPGKIKFDFVGTAIADSDLALLSGVSYQSSLAQPFQNASFTINSYAAIIEALTITSGNKIELRDSVNSLQGFLSAIIGERMATLKLSPEDVLIATHDFWATWEAGTRVALSALLGSTAGNRLTITAPRVQYKKVGQGERKGLATYEIDAMLTRYAGDDELSLAFT